MSSEDLSDKYLELVKCALSLLWTFVLFVAVIAFQAFLLMYGWNIAMVHVFHVPSIDLWQAICLRWVANTLFCRAEINNEVKHATA